MTPKDFRTWAAAIPAFGLYGEGMLPPDADFLHIETIRARSALHDWEIAEHLHRGLFQVLWLFEGGGEARLDGRRVALRAPLAITLPPAAVHGFRFEAETAGHVLTLSESRLAAAAGSALDMLFASPRALSLASDLAASSAGLLDVLESEFLGDAPQRDALLDALLRATLLLLARAGGETGARPHAWLRAETGRSLLARFLALVDAHHAEHLPVSHYAERLHVTERTLTRQCRQLCGRAPLALIQDRLLLEARRRLSCADAPLAVIAYELGFEDPAYFCRFFKRHTGMTPSAFRRAGAEVKPRRQNVRLSPAKLTIERRNSYARSENCPPEQEQSQAPQPSRSHRERGHPPHHRGA